MDLIKTHQGAVSAHLTVRRVAVRRRRPAIRPIEPPKLVIVKSLQPSKAA